MLIYVDEPTVQGRMIEAHPDQLAESHRLRTPSRAYGRKALFAPALYPGLEMTGKSLKRSARRDCPEILFGDRRGRKLRVSRRRGEIDADADDNKLGGLTLVELRFEADSGYLATAQKDVVWPLIVTPCGLCCEGPGQRAAYRPDPDEAQVRGMIHRVASLLHQTKA